jgi:4-amino-4-deoxy-L-arabinose transferase-like glycosyltransferase
MLLLFCAAWIVPGVFGRDPWRNDDLAAFGVMLAMAEGRTSWLAPTLGGVPVTPEPLAHWLGAGSIALLSPWLDAALAARLPFAVLLALTLALTWYACFHLARTEAAQPVAFAFGGEADPVAYARAVADGALLALIATLGLLQLGHETTPELMQLSAVSLCLWSVAAAPYRRAPARWGVATGLGALALAGAPTVVLILGTALAVISHQSAYDGARRLVPWIVAGMLAGSGLATSLGIWGWRLAFAPEGAQLVQILRQWSWFLWPAWLLALWTLWRWRAHWQHRHISVPAALMIAGLVTSVWMGGHDGALMLALPGLAVLAAFALPTLRRSVAAAIDWFSVIVFSLCAVLIWFTYVAMHTGQPARWAANITKLQPGFQPSFSALALGVALAGTFAWLALVRWRTGRSQHALWKTLVLPASGVALSWLLLMTLWLPLLDYARSARPLIERGLPHLAAARCIAAPEATPSMVAALEVHAKRPVVAGEAGSPDTTRCPVLVSFSRVTAAVPLPGWRLVAAERRHRESSDLMAIYQRL